MNQTHSSWQHNILPNNYQRTDCEATAAAEVSSQYGVANRNPYNPEVTYFPFPNVPNDQERQFRSTHLLHPSEVNIANMNQNAQFCDAWNPNPPVNTLLPIAEPCFLPGYQQTFGQGHALRNQFQHPNVSSQVENSGTSRTDEMPSKFTSNYNEIDNVSANEISQQYETSLLIPILAVENAQCNPMDTIPPTDAISPIHSNKSLEEYLPKDGIEPQDRSSSHAGRYACRYCDKTCPSSWHLTRHIRTYLEPEKINCSILGKLQQF
ncbi:hypothetical protein CDAR_193301 [Caerostris darwini]|uniref:C2H2-type domain-containing protein n=1 Tax=Caerostris darwini TaxID=1538125 RepID=A0AAV4QZG0_9ARAC|nr:hypothetical protein CDAR_193301 [Caerostris darwini]